MVMVDSIEKIEVIPSDCTNELRSLQTLYHGMQRIYGMVKRRELIFEANAPTGMVTAILGRDFDGTTDHLDAIACFFHWFGISVCNFARLVGFLRGLKKNEFMRSDLQNKSKFTYIKTSINAYRDSIPELAEVHIWRNKVFGHYAITDPYKDDNIATLDMSVVFPISWENGHYVAGGMTMIKNSAAGSFTSELPYWSFTKVFESLIPRYWPNFVPPTVEQVKQALQT